MSDFITRVSDVNEFYFLIFDRYEDVFFNFCLLYLLIMIDFLTTSENKEAYKTSMKSYFISICDIIIVIALNSILRLFLNKIVLTCKLNFEDKSQQ